MGLNDEKGIFTGDFYKKFYVPKEDIPIITLEPEQLNYLIFDKDFENSLSKTLKRTKDIFVIGCTISLRFSDIAALKKSNLEKYNGSHYIRVTSKKTQTTTRIKLPDYAVDILKKHKHIPTYLLPISSNIWFNANVKKLIKAAGWTHVFPKFRSRRGKLCQVYKTGRIPFRFYDHITSHTMRRTAITTLLRLGLEENLVRKISGHTAGSKEFYKYVEISQSYMDEKTDKIYDKIEQKRLIMNKNA